MTRHHLPTDMPRQLNLRVVPASRTAAEGYADLLRLLEELGERLDKGTVSKSDLRSWESAVVRYLHDREIDQLMHVPDEAAFETVALPEQRWRNLRSILLARKGLKPSIC